MVKKIADPRHVENETAGHESNGKAITKSQAAREAIDAGFGMPNDAIEFIKSKFGIDMDKMHFSAVKSTYKKSVAAKAKPVGRTKAVAANGHAVEISRKHANDEADLVGSLETLKPMIAALGIDRVRRLVDLLA